MKILSYVLMYSLLLLSIFNTGCTDIINGESSNQNLEKTPELNLTIVPEKTDLEEGETSYIHLTLTNIGNYSLNVWKMEPQISYDISFRSLADNSSANYICPVISRPALTNEFLAELKTGESLNSTFNSNCWVLNPGEYMLSAVYHTAGGERISKPYWRGEVRSNEVLIEVQDTKKNITTPSLIDPPQMRS